MSVSAGLKMIVKKSKNNCRATVTGGSFPNAVMFPQRREQKND